jgi:gamma-glutamyltranspeptidase/glutathione hydrolase
MDPLAEQFRRDPALARVFLRPDGTQLKPGDKLVQRDLAHTLELISRQGTDGFYRGPIAAALSRASAAQGGILSEADLAGYTIAETTPLKCSYRGYVFVSVPPPSSGGTTMCEILNILEGYDMKALGFHSAASIRVMAEAMRYAYQDRNTYLGDPAFVSNPLDRLLSKDYAATIRTRIESSTTPPESSGPPSREKAQTTHYSVVDEDGNAVSVTYTLNGSFGALVMAPGTGFLLNDEMDDFTIKPGVPNLFGLIQGDANAIAPGKRPLSSMSPAIVTHDGKPVLVLGSPGGSRIITITLETALNIIDHGMAPQAAVDAPRIHYQGLPDKIFVEPFALSPDTERILRGQGYTLTEQAPWGGAELIAISPGRLLGANDNRRPAGAAIGR